MQEQLVTFETAKLAKEKGFDWRDIKILEIKSKSAYLDSTTQSLLQKWLREIYNIHIYITATSLGDYAVFITDSWNKHLISNKKIYNNAVSCSYTYEEALEIGLQEGLKIIE